MTISEFRATLSDPNPPEVPALIGALWWDAKGDWKRAHSIAQEIDDASAAWVHAYLHRREGDLANAEYWYGRARRPVATDSLDEEWARIVSTLFADGV